MALEAQLRYIFVEGLKGALASLGWESVPRDDALVFTKKVNGVAEVLAFRNSKAFTRREIAEATDNTKGISYKEFEKAYVAHYKGNPPLMPL